MSWEGVKEINDQNSTKMYTIGKTVSLGLWYLVKMTNGMHMLCHNELYLCAYLFGFHLP
jgi:hypothetical protein